jgi:hypothetical protein
MLYQLSYSRSTEAGELYSARTERRKATLTR